MTASGATEAKAPGSGGRGPLGVLFLVVFLDLLGFGILIPQLGVYAVKFQAAPFTVGLLLSVYSLMQLIFAPVLGKLSDRYGRRPVLLYSIAGSALGYVLFGLAHSLLLLFVARVIDGISGGNVSTAQAYVADVTTDENRAKGMGIIGASFGLGFIFGPAIGGFLGAHWGNAGIGFVSAGLAALNWVLAWFLLPESKPKGEKPAHSAQRESLTKVTSALQLPVAGLGILLFFVYTTAFSEMEGTFSVFLIQKYLAGGALHLTGNLWGIKAEITDALTHDASIKAGWIFVVVGVLSALIQGGLIGRLRHRFGEPALVITGCALLTVSLVAIPFAPSYGWLFVPMGVLAVGSALVQPSLSAAVSLAAPPARQGEVLGAYQSMSALGRIVGPALGGLFFSLGGAGLPYFTAGTFMLACVVMAVVLRGQMAHSGLAVNQRR